MGHVGYRSATAFVRGLASLLLLLVCAGLGSCASTHVAFFLDTDETSNGGNNFDVHVFQLRDTTKLDQINWNDLRKFTIDRFGEDGALGETFIKGTALTLGLDSSKNSHTVSFELKEGAGFVGIFGRFQNGTGKPMVAYPPRELKDARIMVTGFSLLKAGSEAAESSEPEAAAPADGKTEEKTEDKGDQ